MTDRALTLLFAGAFVLGGCQYLPGANRHWAKVTPVPTTAAMAGPTAREDELYRRAVLAIDQRNYGGALDVLQLARENRPDDARVLTAMGVVYDKLGRFDLSQRYYGLAEAADPGSKVVAIDRSYSLVLQQRRGAEQASDGLVVMAAPAPTRRAIAIAVAKADFQPLIHAPTAPLIQARTAQGSLRIGGPVRIRNATGKAAGVDLVQAGLTARGWRLASAGAEPRKSSAVSLLQFPPSDLRVASGLAHTLPFSVKLESCASCTRMELVLGANARPLARRGPQAKARQA